MKKLTTVRYLILGGFLLAFSILSFMHFVMGGDKAASIDALCPFGGFESLYTFILTGGFVPRIMISSMILAIAIIVTVLIFRRAFCGWICPFGTVQEILARFTKNKMVVPKKVDKYGRYMKYVVLIWILVSTGIYGTLVFRGYDPFMTFFHFGKGLFWDYNAQEALEHLPAYLITAVVLAGSILINRFWCKYFCPLGAITAILAKFGLTGLNRNNKCINCKLCDKACPVDIKVSKLDSVKSVECLDCGLCENACPKNAIETSVAGKKVPALAIGIGVSILFLAIIFGAKASGYWESVPTIEDIIAEGKDANLEEIKGWMTLSEVSQITGICISHLIMDFNLPPDIDINTAIRDLSQKYGIKVHSDDIIEYAENFKHDEDENEHLLDSIDSLKDAPKEVACPWKIEEDSYPGLCSLYIDLDKNRICDYSE